MADPLREVRPGEVIDANHPAFSAARHNALTRLVDPSRRGAVPSPGPEIGGGVASAGGGEWFVGLLNTNLAGATASGSGVTLGTGEANVAHSASFNPVSAAFGSSVTVYNPSVVGHSHDEGVPLFGEKDPDKLYGRLCWGVVAGGKHLVQGVDCVLVEIGNA